MSTLTLEHLTQAAVAAGLEIYRANGSEIRIAERQRVHLMDSGVAISLQATPRVTLTIRSQRSDFPTEAAEELFRKVRDRAGEDAAKRGFSEVSAITRDITDPVDPTQVLDVWHEVTFAKDVGELDALFDDVRWALLVPKCVDP